MTRVKKVSISAEERKLLVHDMRKSYRKFSGVWWVLHNNGFPEHTYARIRVLELVSSLNLLFIFSSVIVLFVDGFFLSFLVKKDLNLWSQKVYTQFFGNTENRKGDIDMFQLIVAPWISKIAHFWKSTCNLLFEWIKVLNNLGENPLLYSLTSLTN